MPNITTRGQAKLEAINRKSRKASIPTNPTNGKVMKVGQYFGENVFFLYLAKGIPESVKSDLQNAISTGKPLSRELAEIYANAVTEWASSKGVTHFCHWFQPLTGSTAEKHDAFLTFERNYPIEKLSVNQLMQGEPDASSFPHGGSRSTFEARGYTAWDITSPMFIMENTNGKTLCIPTAFVSYHGDALDIKTPLLRSVSVLGEYATRFLKLVGHNDIDKVTVTCGAEQEYFLVDKAFYYNRRDLVMCGRTLLGSLTSRNQQLEDHYFGEIPERVIDFMQEVEIELYRLGVPAKTRHNEVAPGQFELACIFRDANIAADHNQLVMATLRKVASKHDFVVLLHEKPFEGINGSGKHLNWSLATEKGVNLLEPGTTPHENYIFLAFITMILEMVNRHAKVIRASVAGHGNDHRLGANEAPPSILSVFLGETITNILDNIKTGQITESTPSKMLDIGAKQLVNLLKDNTDRNRTSPFAFTGNKFEFRAVGSTHAVGFPLSILNGALADVLKDACDYLEKCKSQNKSIDECLINLIKEFYNKSSRVVFNGDGYSKDWEDEAAKRQLPNLKNSADALGVFNQSDETKFLVKMGIMRSSELKTRYNILLERYIKYREIEFNTLTLLVDQHVLPAALTFKEQLVNVVKGHKEIGKIDSVSSRQLDRLVSLTDRLYSKHLELGEKMLELPKMEETKAASTIATELMKLSESISSLCNEIEDVVPDNLWNLPTYFDMLFVR